MKKKILFLIFVSVIVLIASGTAMASEAAGGAARDASGPPTAPISPQSRKCINCHLIYTPGIVEEWLSSAHSGTTPEQAMKKPPLERLVSAKDVPKDVANYAVGCYECHGANPGAHKDNFQHFGESINVVVSPADCAICHPEERAQFDRSMESYAWSNLDNNPLFHTLMDTIIGTKDVSGGRIVIEKPESALEDNTCYSCHGLPVKMAGMKQLSTPVGLVNVPVLKGWPNTGIGRINPDGSRGACEACHPGHAFSIEAARKPYTCARCHTGPHAPAWDVYRESSHGSIFLTNGAGWNFARVPWRPGVDFKAPTCAACHNSLLVGTGGKIIAQRTHDSGSRLWVRLLGLIYSTAQPKKGDTTIIENKDGLPLPSTFDGVPASRYLIGKDKQQDREESMKSICNACHGNQWTDGFFSKMSDTVQAADKMTLAATKLMDRAWRLGLSDKTNPFSDETEMDWVRQWFFYATSVKYSAAMAGATNRMAFTNGFWDLSYNLRKMESRVNGTPALRPAPMRPRIITIPEAPQKEERRVRPKKRFFKKRAPERRIIKKRAEKRHVEKRHVEKRRAVKRRITKKRITKRRAPKAAKGKKKIERKKKKPEERK